jgi:hypothetical protein
VVAISRAGSDGILHDGVLEGFIPQREDLDLVNFCPKEGELLVSGCTSRFLLALVDSSGTSVASRYMYEGEVIQKGSYITFPHHVIKIQDKAPL